MKVGKINGSRSLFLADTKNNTKEFQKSIKVRIGVIDENDEVKYTNNVDAGMAAVIVTGIGIVYFL